VPSSSVVDSFGSGLAILCSRDDRSRGEESCDCVVESQLADIRDP
jgi:hypothetical protein